MVSTMVVAVRAENALNEIGNKLEHFESETLKTLIECAKQEQEVKDELLLNVITKWQETHPKGRIIIFCSVKSVGDHVDEYLKGKLDMKIERHQVGVAPLFCSDEDVKIFVCDQAGEDGLNLNGGEKLVIHYSLPLSFSRI